MNQCHCCLVAVLHNQCHCCSAAGCAIEHNQCHCCSAGCAIEHNQCHRCSAAGCAIEPGGLCIPLIRAYAGNCSLVVIEHFEPVRRAASNLCPAAAVYPAVDSVVDWGHRTNKLCVIDQVSPGLFDGEPNSKPHQTHSDCGF